MSERPDEFEMKPRQVAAKRYAQKREVKPVERWSGMDLAWYFARTVPGMHNVQALAGSLARWRKGGLSSEKIKAMIDLYAPRHRPGTSAWRSFIYNRDRLGHEVDNREQRDRDDPVYQMGRRN